jgi:serine/threonine protein kinase
MLGSGEILSHYRIISAIGAGGMGEVYRAQDTRLDRQVALKILLEEVATDETRIQRFVQEAKAVSALNHPNILTVFEIGNFNGVQYMATEFIKGETLRERMQNDPLRLKDTLEVVLQVAAALSAAHEVGIIHRDIKPENIMIREDGLVKVLDFGLAKVTGAPAENADTTLPHFNTQPGMLVGTVAYMSPEQARGRKLDPRSDIFSLGILTFELLTGRRPFDGEGQLDIISSILKDEPPALRQVAPDLPRQLERIVEKSLRKDRDHRYQHVKDLHIDIEDLRDELKFEAKLNQTAQPTYAGEAFVTNPSDVRSALRTGISKTRRFTLLHAMIFIAFTAVIVGAVWYLRPGRSALAKLPGSFKTAEAASWNSAPGELFSSARFSPDAKLIAFASTKSGTKNIWVTQTGSTEAIQITNDAFSNTDPVWSAKGDEIAYFSDRGAGGGNISGIWRVGTLGGTPKLVGQLDTKSVELRRWTVSGKIYFEMKNDLYVMDVTNGSAQPVTSFGQGNASLINVASDEKSIIYVTRQGNEWRMLAGEIGSEKTREIEKGQGMVDGMSWVPEKKRIFYGARVEGVLQIFMTVAGSGESSRITASETDCSVVDASPDGRSILYSSAKEESNLWRINVTDGQETTIARDLNANLWPAVSPDNTKVAFQSIKNLSQGNHLFEGAIVTKSVKQRDDGEKAATLAAKGFLPSWSPDGSVIAFLKKIDGKDEIMLLNPNGGERKLTSGGVSGQGYSVSPYNYIQTKGFAWSPDGTKIAFAAKRDENHSVWFVDITSGVENRVTANPEAGVTIANPIWSPDGRKLAFSFLRPPTVPNERPTRGVRIAMIDGGESATVYESKRGVGLIGWSADGSSVIVAEAEKPNSGTPQDLALKRVSTLDRKETAIADLKNVYFYNIFLADDQKSIAFAARNEDKDDIWVIPTAGGTARKVTNNNDPGLYFSRLAWFHDGSAIAFGKQTRYSLLSMIMEID